MTNWSGGSSCVCIGQDDRIERRNADDLSPDDVADLRARLDRLDRRSPTGPWTRSTLRLIEQYPGVVSTALARHANQERPAFKLNVRKLKELGLTESLEVGYRLSPRGQAVLARAARMSERDTVRVLLLADTHLGPGQAQRLIERLPRSLARADVILHAGDIVDGSVLDALARYAPVHAVLGNNDRGLDLPIAMGRAARWMRGRDGARQRSVDGPRGSAATVVPDGRRGRLRPLAHPVASDRLARRARAAPREPRARPCSVAGSRVAPRRGCICDRDTWSTSATSPCPATSRDVRATANLSRFLPRTVDKLG